MAPSNTPQNERSAHNNVEKRKLRNRLAQRAFRRRQADHLRELRNQASSKNEPQDETIRKLREENSRLRKTLIDVQSKLARMTANMQALSEAVSQSTEGPTRDTEDPILNHDGVDLSLSQILTEFESGALEDDVVIDHDSHAAALAKSPMKTPSGICLDLPEKSQDNSISVVTPRSESISERISNLAQEIPSIWSFEYQMGTDPYTRALSSMQSPRMRPDRSWTETNSPFSDHIQTLRMTLKNKVDLNKPATGPAMLFFYQEVMMLLSLFNSLTRPDVMKWYAKTRFYHIVNLTAWQINPCTKTYNSIHPQYRPTKLQLQNPYPSVIDWIPFPSIRDRLIQLHSANPQIDQIFCDTVSSYVVETWMSELIMGAPSIKAYIRVTDIIANFDSQVHEDPADLMTALPAPDVATIFNSPVCSRAVFNKLNMSCGVSIYKIDPSFFGSYPELYDHNYDIAAQGIPLRPDVQCRLTCPKPLDTQTFQTYRNFVDFSYDSPIWKTWTST